MGHSGREYPTLNFAKNAKFRMGHPGWAKILFRTPSMLPPARKVYLCAAFVLLAAGAVGQQGSAKPDEQNLRGTWIASAGPNQMFRGRWWASLVPGKHNAAQGSWTLLSNSNQILLEGTWSARKSPGGWQGTWSARAGKGRAFSGTWTSSLSDINVKTFEDMLKAALEKQVSGSWQSGRMHGSWWLQGSG
jgi:hypothetical protein